MSDFNPGDRVTITNPAPERAKWRDKTGVVEHAGQSPDELVAVQGLEGRFREAIIGYIGFYPEELTKA